MWVRVRAGAGWAGAGFATAVAEGVCVGGWGVPGVVIVGLLSMGWSRS